VSTCVLASPIVSRFNETAINKHSKETKPDELTLPLTLALFEITLPVTLPVIEKEITPKTTLDGGQKEEGERQKQFHHGNLII
jgi:hypothetical protein